MTDVAGISRGLKTADNLLFLDNLLFAQQAFKRKIKSHKIFISIPLPISIEITYLVLWLKYIDGRVGHIYYAFISSNL